MGKQKVLSVTADDCEWQYFRAGGKGGQAQNKTSSGARVIHHPSGARGESREERSQLQNRKNAFKRMTQDIKFKLWLNAELMQGPTPEEQVEKDMNSRNIKVEGKVNGIWQEL